MKNLRRHLEPTYAEYPAKLLWRIFGRKIIKLILWLLCSGVWLGFICLGASVIDIKEADASGKKTELTIIGKVTSTGGLTIFGVGSLIMLICIARAGSEGQYISINEDRGEKQKRPEK